MIELVSYSPSPSPELKGSAAKKQFRFPGDMDFFQRVRIAKKDRSLVQVYWQVIKGFQRLARKVKNSSLVYWVELKAGEYKGEKLRWTANEVLNGYKIVDGHRVSTMEMFSNPEDVIKLDTIHWDQPKRRFIEVSTIYALRWTNHRPILDEGKKEFEKEIRQEYQQLMKSGNVYKAMKRLYLLTTNEKEKELLEELFNSPIGELSQIKNDIVQTNLVATLSQSQITKKRIREAKLRIRHRLDMLGFDEEAQQEAISDPQTLGQRIQQMTKRWVAERYEKR